ncbi:ribonuclease HI family protein [Enterococcus alcedinis]|uniref:Ribonuclease HI n=1 Tax=Enterococcus alcedinis TaxID=1274384 RepID=A0A917N5L7_9ENTE|nr:ribonuclease HI family protein [Enterococcus alcedinis]MBP2100865.1 ribonuclease HI [Enterococcus alcedinis]GGI64837.1 ribonuclease HI [Enterococcus alcedinis]
MIKAYIDAATKGNPGPSGGGIVLVGEDLHLQKTVLLPVLTNHQAEFAVMIALLKYLIQDQKTQETIFIFTDSKILAETIEKDYTKNQHFIEYLEEIQQLLTLFKLVIIQWIPESKNKGADHLARQALQKVLKSQNRR